MYWRSTHSEFMQHRGDANKIAFKNVVDSGKVPGILAYAEDQPVGWCAVAQRDTFPRLERSRILKRIDDEPVWSVVCFFVEKAFRRKGVSVGLLRAAVDYVRKEGGKIHATQHSSARLIHPAVQRGPAFRLESILASTASSGSTSVSLTVTNTAF